MSGGTATRARFATDELVVATPHRDLVLGELAQLRDQVTRYSIKAADPRLGLSLISVTHAAGPDDETALTALLVTIRDRCSKRFDGWVPTIGKNRLLDRIDGASGYVGGGGVGGASGYVGGGGGGLPTPAQAAAIPSSPAGKLGRGVGVAILDTQLYPHPDLAGRYITEDGNALLRDPSRVPYHAGHATFVAGLVMQRAPYVVLNVHNALDENGEATAWDVTRKMVDFADAGVSILNLSLGCFTDDGAPPLLFQRAVELLAPNVVIVAAAGNHGAGNVPYDVKPNTAFWPAALDDVVAVGAHDSSGQRAAFSPNAPWVTLSAPGVDVASTYLAGEVEVVDAKGSPECREYGGYATWSGTSFAAAAVTGKIAADTVPTRRSSKEARDALLQGQPGVDIWAYDHRQVT